VRNKFWFAVVFVAILSIAAWGQPSIDSVWFSEETDCNNQNIVTICYILSGDTADISVRVSADGGATWTEAGEGWFSTLSDTAGDLGTDIIPTAPDSHCFRWDMSEDMPDSEGCDFQVAVSLLSYDYWLPYTIDYTACASGHTNRFYIRAHYDSTDVEIDFDNDGVIDSSFTLNANGSRSYSVPIMAVGMHIVSTKPLWCFYVYGCSNHGLYEDGNLSYTIYPAELAGNEYVVPPADFTTVFAIDDGTVVNVDSDYSGSVDFTFTLDSGENNTFSTIAHPAHIYTDDDKRIILVNSFHSSDYYSTTAAYYLLPIDRLGMNYFAPQIHSYTLDVNSLDSRVEVVATEDATNLVINGAPYSADAGDLVTYISEAEISVSSDKPVMTVYISDVNATDPWGSHEHRRYMYAFQLFPEEELSKRYVLPATGGVDSRGFPRVQYSIVSFSDGNLIEIDASDDDIIDTSYTLNTGDISYYHEGDYVPFVSDFVAVESTYPVQVTYSRRGWWSSRSETCDGRITISGELSDEDSATGCLDSRPPTVTITNCPTTISSGEEYTFEWSVVDSFWINQPCSLHIFGCGIDEGYEVPDTFYIWSVPAVSCPECTLIVAARDSFCNWGYDTCMFEIRYCTPAYAEVLCPLPCGSFSSCPNQRMIFMIQDTTGVAIDTSRLYFTIISNHPTGSADTLELVGTSRNVTLEGRPDSLIATVVYFYADGDSVVISLDSVYNVDSCLTTFFPDSCECRDNSDCLMMGWFCRKATGDCDGCGVCEECPTACPDIWDPVCGCDGITYSNECYAHRVGVNVAHRGECGSKQK